MEFKMCWSLANLQPLWKKENNSKYDNIDYYTKQKLKEFGVLNIYNYIKRNI